LYSFQNGNGDGNFPNAYITVGNDGNFYTTTQYGGEFNNGAVIKISANGIESVIYSFESSNDGINLYSQKNRHYVIKNFCINFHFFNNYNTPDNLSINFANLFHEV
jgi:uncharacterized repeat protein (TIGR03803 family)